MTPFLASFPLPSDLFAKHCTDFFLNVDYYLASLNFVIIAVFYFSQSDSFMKLVQPLKLLVLGFDSEWRCAVIFINFNVFCLT